MQTQQSAILMLKIIFLHFLFALFTGEIVELQFFEYAGVYSIQSAFTQLEIETLEENAESDFKQIALKDETIEPKENWKSYQFKNGGNEIVFEVIAKGYR